MRVMRQCLYSYVKKALDCERSRRDFYYIFNLPKQLWHYYELDFLKVWCIERDHFVFDWNDFCVWLKKCTGDIVHSFHSFFFCHFFSHLLSQMILSSNHSVFLSYRKKKELTIWRRRMRLQTLDLLSTRTSPNYRVYKPRSYICCF